MTRADAEQFEAWALAQARTYVAKDGRLATRAFVLLRSGARGDLLLPDARAAWPVVVADYRTRIAATLDAVGFVAVTEQYAALEAWGELAALDGGAVRAWRCPLLRGEGRARLAAGHWTMEDRA